MDFSSTTGTGPSCDLLVDIVETLETCGLGWDEYQLYDFIDVEALEQVLNSSSEDIEVQFSVEGIRLAVTRDNIKILPEESGSTD